MNEKFLSRGKREDTGKWVTGYYVELPEDQHGKNFCLIIGLDDQYNRIIPETAGRCTGLTDRNGKKIFEGDILREYIENLECEYDYDHFDCGRVFWYRQRSRFLRTSRMFVDDCPEITEYREYEVIGNIHDNSELIGGTE